MNKNKEELYEIIDSIKTNADKIQQIMNNNTIDAKTGEIEDNTVTFYGKFVNNDNTNAKFRTDSNVKNLINQDLEKVAKILSAFGNVERFKIIELLFERSRTANEIMEALNFKTTGKVYHHLNILIASGLVSKFGDDTYRVKAKFLQGILAMLVGCSCFIRHENE